MTKMVTAYDTRTGEALPNPVPQTWLDKGVFPHLSATAVPKSPAPKPADVPAATNTKKET